MSLAGSPSARERPAKVAAARIATATARPMRTPATLVERCGVDHAARQPDAERRAAALAVLDPDDAVVQARELRHQRESDAGTRRALDASPDEELEDLVLVLVRD